MPDIHYLTVEGEEYLVPASAGESLMQAALKSGVPGIIGECGGELSCGTCHIYIGEDWSSRLRPRSQDEEDLLESIDSMTQESRLGCQVKTTDDLDGLVVQVAPQ